MKDDWKVKDRKKKKTREKEQEKKMVYWRKDLLYYISRILIYTYIQFFMQNLGIYYSRLFCLIEKYHHTNVLNQFVYQFENNWFFF